MSSAPEFNVGLRETADPVDAFSAAGPDKQLCSCYQPSNTAGEPVLPRHSTAESDFRFVSNQLTCPNAACRRHDGNLHLASPVAAQYRVPRTQNSKGACVCATRSPAHSVTACHSWAKGQYTRDQPSIRRHCRGGDRQPSSNVQTRMVTGCGRLVLGRRWPGRPALGQQVLFPATDSPRGWSVDGMDGQKPAFQHLQFIFCSIAALGFQWPVAFTVVTLRLRGDWVDRKPGGG
jgi:hypothetical protein